MRTSLQVAGKSVSFSNLSKPLYASGFTKEEVIDYYARIAEAILPHLKGRAVSFKRYPNGTGAKCFFQKNRPEHAPESVKSVLVTGSEGEQVDYVLVGDLATLLWAANSAALEMHVTLEKAKADARPDSIVFDLDPGPEANLLDCARLGLKLRAELKESGLECLAKTSGSKGLHVFIPLNTATTFEQTRAFARAIAEALAAEDPEHVTAVMAKNLRAGKIFVDWNQNKRHQTTVCAYSLRGTANPSVSTPVTWEELENAVKRKKIDRLAFTPKQVLDRVAKHGDLFAPMLTMKQKLPRATGGPPVPMARGKGAARDGKVRRTSPPASLKTYEAKRNFAESPEPRGDKAPTLSKGKGKAKGKGLSFCVQKHWASRLHYDFRLEHDGVLLSWAVQKGPSLRPANKRLAMHVEDHPVEYGDFEGVIPSGYGAGTVMLWDRGTWSPESPDVDAALAKGELKFLLEGVKLKGSWVLVQTRGRGREDGRSWLLIKHRDDWAGDVDVTEAAPLSVKTFRDVEEIRNRRA